MNLLDAYGLISFLIGGAATAQVRTILRQGDSAMATANLAEVLDVSQRVHRLPISRALAAIEPLLDSALVLVPLDGERAEKAAMIRATHYHRSSRPISLADAILVASAAPGDTVISADRHVRAVATAEGIDAVELPGGG